ncbi:MAG: hypothetical protein CM1200mP37_2050 [Chloroflexota bacterium]|nr:MAG: hypothetical protein CM1200mP37_2050 [Chloroflexota bacterium]
MSDLATVGAIQSKATDAAINFSNAVTIQIVGGVLWNGLFFYWGVAFIIFGDCSAYAKEITSYCRLGICSLRYNFPYFEHRFPIDLGQAIFIVFGLMVVNTIVGGVFLLKGK